MNDSVFNPDTFLDAQQEEVNEKRPNFPVTNPDSEDGLYTAMIGEIKTQSGIISKGDNEGRRWICMVIPLKIQFGPAIQALGLPAEFQLTDRAFLDLTEDDQSLDNSKGKNRQQFAYREALGMNVPGEPFSWRLTQGRMVKIAVTHELYEGTIQEKVGQILPA